MLFKLRRPVTEWYTVELCLMLLEDLLVLDGVQAEDEILSGSQSELRLIRELLDVVEEEVPFLYPQPVNRVEIDKVFRTLVDLNHF